MTTPKPPILPARRCCLDCGDLMLVDDVDEVAVCDECTRVRRAAEDSLQGGDGQAGARWIGQQRENALRPTLAELQRSRKSEETS
jgi:hypothetical protein